VGDLLVGLRERGLEVTRPILVVIDGATALRRAVLEVLDHPVIQRCQLHKLRDVADRLPDAVASTVAKRMRAADHHPDPLVAQAELEHGQVSWTAPTRARPPRRARGWPRPSPSAGLACHPPLLERCHPRMKVSRPWGIVDRLGRG
jgi:putative transposase